MRHLIDGNNTFYNEDVFSSFRDIHSHLCLRTRHYLQLCLSLVLFKFYLRLIYFSTRQIVHQFYILLNSFVVAIIDAVFWSQYFGLNRNNDDTPIIFILSYTTSVTRKHDTVRENCGIVKYKLFISFIMPGFEWVLFRFYAVSFDVDYGSNFLRYTDFEKYILLNQQRLVLLQLYSSCKSSVI